MYRFSPIDLERDRETIGEFLIDSFKISQMPIEDESALIDVYCNSIRRKESILLFIDV